MQALKMAYDFNESLTLTSVSSRRVYDDECAVDWDFSRETLRHTWKDNQYRKISQETRLNYAKNRLKWLLGVYYDNDDTDIDYETESVYPMLAGVTSRNLEGDAYAVFGNISLPLAGPLGMFAGLRYEKQNLSFRDNLDKRAFDDAWDAVSPRVGLEYRFVPELMVYASVSKGYRSGGFNMFASDSRYYSYDPESLWNYEIGGKGEFFGYRLVVNGAIYYMDISDMQVTEAISAAESYVTNAAAATALGAEIEAQWHLTDNLSLMVGLAYSDVKFDTFKDALGDYADNKSPYAPDYTINFGMQYRHASGFHARADMIGYGRMYYDRANVYSKSAYQIVNAKVGYEMERFDISVYGNNLFDTAYNDYGYSNGYYTIYSAPGEIGVQVTYRF
jgi:iron complex outermembrane receptor protein